MIREIHGIHHVTAITGDPQANIDFYTGVLGLRMVKLTVNFDDPEAYHLYFGDSTGRPGTIVTFFAWPGAPRGRRGTGQVTTISFAVPQGSLGYWSERLAAHRVEHERPTTRFERGTLRFFDPDGLQLQLVETTGPALGEPWHAAGVREEHAILGLWGVELTVEGYERTARVLTDTLDFRLVESAGSTYRYSTGTSALSTIVDVQCAPDAQHGQVAVGTVHHVAFRTPDYEQQKSWRVEVARAGLNVTPIIDRLYFRSIYFREPGGVLFEIATVPPGFAVDEPIESLGTRLALPPWLEPMRERLERTLPPVRLPEPPAQPARAKSRELVR